jgi:hypothetical protein
MIRTALFGFEPSKSAKMDSAFRKIKSLLNEELEFAEGKQSRQSMSLTKCVL